MFRAWPDAGGDLWSVAIALERAMWGGRNALVPARFEALRRACPPRPLGLPPGSEQVVTHVALVAVASGFDDVALSLLATAYPEPAPAGLPVPQARFRVLSAAGGAEAIGRVREHAGQIRLVLLDLTMPDMAGDEVLRGIREIDPDVRVLLNSGYDETDAMSRIPSSKVWGFVAKPYRPAELLGRVREALSAETEAP